MSQLLGGLLPERWAALGGSVALVIFVTLFVAVVLWVMRRSQDERYERAARLPLEDDPGPPAAGLRSVGSDPDVAAGASGASEDHDGGTGQPVTGRPVTRSQGTEKGHA